MVAVCLRKKGKIVVLFEALQFSNLQEISPGRTKFSWKKHKGAQQFYVLTYNERKKLRLNLKQPSGLSGM